MNLALPNLPAATLPDGTRPDGRPASAANPLSPEGELADAQMSELGLLDAVTITGDVADAPFLALVTASNEALTQARRGVEVGLPSGESLPDSGNALPVGEVDQLKVAASSGLSPTPIPVDGETVGAGGAIALPKLASESAKSPGKPVRIAAPDSQAGQTALLAQALASAAASANGDAGGAPGQSLGNGSTASVPNSAAPISAAPSHEAKLAPALDQVIEQLAQTREIGRSARPEMLVRHAEFGMVSMRIDATTSDMRATLSNRDPSFVPAVQAMLAERAIAASSESANTGQRGSDQGQSQTQNQAHNQAQGQHGQSSQPAPFEDTDFDRAESGLEEGTAREHEIPADSHRNPTRSDDSGLFA